MKRKGEKVVRGLPNTPRAKIAMEKVALTRVKWYTRARSSRNVTSASSRDLLEAGIRISKGDERFSFRERGKVSFSTYSRAFSLFSSSATPCDDSEWWSLIPGSLSTLPRRTNETHTLDFENPASSRERNKTWEKIAREVFLFLSLYYSQRDSIVFVFVSGRRRHSSCGRSSLFLSLVPLVKYLPCPLPSFSCTECLSIRPSQSPGPRAPTKRARCRDASSRFESLIHHLLLVTAATTTASVLTTEKSLSIFLPSRAHLRLDAILNK